jgi:hypothetical protein
MYSGKIAVPPGGGGIRIPRVVQIMSIIFQTGHELSIVLGNESTSASARVRLPSTIE